MVGVRRTHKPVFHDGCTFRRLRPRHRTLDRPGAKPVHDDGTANGTPVNLALLRLHAAVYCVRFCARLRPTQPNIRGRPESLNRRCAGANVFGQRVGGLPACVPACPPSTARGETCRTTHEERPLGNKIGRRRTTPLARHAKSQWPPPVESPYTLSDDSSGRM